MRVSNHLRYNSVLGEVLGFGTWKENSTIIPENNQIMQSIILIFKASTR